MSPRRSAEETRELIRGTALRLFRERGYDATTMRVVAQEAGVAVGNAYHHFGSKDDLVQELYREVNREHAERVRPVLAEGGDLAERLRVNAPLAGFDRGSLYTPGPRGYLDYPRWPVPAS